MIHGHKHSTLINCGYEIGVLSEVVARELSTGWNSADWKMITAYGNRSHLAKVAESMPVNVHGVVIPVPIFLAKYGSEQVVLGRPRETYDRKCDRNLDDGNCEITISAVDGSDQVTFVPTVPEDERDIFVHSSGNLYAYL